MSRSWSFSSAICLVVAIVVLAGQWNGIATAAPAGAHSANQDVTRPASASKRTRTSSLRVMVRGLPAQGLTARATLRGPRGMRLSRRLRVGSQVLRGLARGRWQVCRTAVRTKHAVFRPTRKCATVRLPQKHRHLRLDYLPIYKRDHRGGLHLRMDLAYPLQAGLRLTGSNGLQRSFTVAAPGRNRVAVTNLTLAAGTYRLELIDLTLPGVGRATGHLAPTTVVVRSGLATTAWATVNDTSAAVTGRAVSAAGSPLIGVPVCLNRNYRYRGTESRCPTRTDVGGRFSVAWSAYLNDYPESEAHVWEDLRLGSPYADIPWRTRSVSLADVKSPIILQPRGFVSGVIRSAQEKGISAERVCAVHPRDHGMDGREYRRTDAMCTSSDARGAYRVRVDGESAQIFLDDDSRAISGHIPEMIDFLARALPVRQWGLPDRGTFDAANVPDERYRQAGDVLDFSLTDWRPGRAITVLGSTSAPNSAVCGATIGGFACTETDADGGFELRLSTLVRPASPDAATVVSVTLQSGSERTTSLSARPGSTVEVDL